MGRKKRIMPRTWRFLATTMTGKQFMLDEHGRPTEDPELFVCKTTTDAEREANRRADLFDEHGPTDDIIAHIQYEVCGRTNRHGMPAKQQLRIAAKQGGYRSVRVTCDLYRRLIKLAKYESRSVAAELNYILTRHLDMEEELAGVPHTDNDEVFTEEESAAIEGVDHEQN